MEVSDTLKKHWPRLLITFIVGGFLLTMVQFIAVTMKNPALAAAAGGIPIGLLSMYMIESEDSREYAKNYLFITIILLCSVIIFYIVQTNVQVWNNRRKYYLVSMIVLLYGTLIYFRTKYASQRKLEEI